MFGEVVVMVAPVFVLRGRAARSFGRRVEDAVEAGARFDNWHG